VRERRERRKGTDSEKDIKGNKQIGRREKNKNKTKNP
jgi:hypothetical protein